MTVQPQTANRVTKVNTIPFNEKDWFTKYQSLANQSEHHVLLESGRGGRYSIMGIHPFAVIEGRDETLSLIMGENKQVWQGSLLESLEIAMKPYMSEAPVNTEIPFCGGAIGYFSYDVVREIEKLPSIAASDLGLPEVFLMLFDDVFVYDHQKNELHICVNGSADSEEELFTQLDRYQAEWEQKKTHAWQERPSKHKENHTSSASMSEETFTRAVQTIKEYIAQGDVFQVNLSLRESKPLHVDPMKVYEQLRVLNPSPYMGYLHTPSFQLVSASPELLVKKQVQQLSTRPIAGTRSRGTTEQDDQRLANSLITNEKERAEHVMLVDLERNDLGRVSRYGTVEVDELLVIERYSHVMHLVSNVVGELADDLSVYDVIRATFPGGTITGAPKVRTMEIIEELEPVRRGIYTGSIGWIGFNGDMELNITIRTMICYDGFAHVQAGAGIVSDSNPEHEYKESFKKARALWRALELSEEEQVKEKQMS